MKVISPVFRSLTAASFVVLLVGGCFSSRSAATGGERLTDTQIATIAMTINDGEITTNNTAAPRLTDPAVRSFAEMMVRDHTSANDRLAAAMTPALTTRAESALSERLREDARLTTERLKAAAAARIDRLHVDEQVRMHQMALRDLDSLLIPNTDGTELRNRLTEMRASVETHLNSVRALQTSLANR